jgi:hypothetical protein
MNGESDDLDLDTDEENEFALVPVGRGRLIAVTLLDVTSLIGATLDAQAILLGIGQSQI